MPISNRRLKHTGRPLRRFSLVLLVGLALACQDRTFQADLKSTDQQVRVRAIEFLGSQRDRSVIPELIEITTDPAVAVRAKASWALGMMQAKEAMGPIVKLLKDPEARVRQSACQALLQIEEPEALPALRAALQAEADEWVRQEMEAAIRHLVQFEGETDVGESSFKGNWL